MQDLVISIGHIGRDYETLATCLRSVFEEDAPGFRYSVWIVYNGPDRPGATAQIERDFPQVKILYRPGPLGFCLTHNLVLRECQARYVLILDDDTVVEKGTLSKMVAFMDAHPRVGMSGCKTLNPDGSFQPTFGLLPSLGADLISIFRPGVYWPDSLYADTSSVRDVLWLNGSFMLVRSETMAQVGVLDEHFYTYLCEPDWACRMVDAGWQVVFVPACSIVHVGGEHSINVKNRKYIDLVRSYVNRFYFFLKHRSRIEYALFRPIAALACLTRIAHYALVYALKPHDRALARTRILGFSRVVRICCARAPHVMPEDVLAAPEQGGRATA